MNTSFYSTNNSSKTSIAIVDDHLLVAQALAGLIQKFDTFEVCFIAENGRVLLHDIKHKGLPDIILLDLNMPEMDGFATAEQLRANYPSIKTIALSMHDGEEQIVRMIQLGARGFLPKGCKPVELKQALEEVRTKGYYYSEYLTEKLIRNLRPTDADTLPKTADLNTRERDFVQLACSDLTYVEIADKMCVSPRTVDGYRESVFQKLHVKSRVGMVIMAIRLGIFSV